VLVLLIRGIYDVHYRGLRRHDIYIPSFMKSGTGVRAMLRICLRNLRGCKCWYYLWEGFMMYTVEMASCDMLTLTKFHEDWYKRSNHIKVMP
jgi:hypothetical protein